MALLNSIFRLLAFTIWDEGDRNEIKERLKGQSEMKDIQSLFWGSQRRVSAINKWAHAVKGKRPRQDPELHTHEHTQYQKTLSKDVGRRLLHSFLPYLCLWLFRPRFFATLNDNATLHQCEVQILSLQTPRKQIHTEVLKKYETIAFAATWTWWVRQVCLLHSAARKPQFEEARCPRWGHTASRSLHTTSEKTWSCAPPLSHILEAKYYLLPQKTTTVKFLPLSLTPPFLTT